MQYLYEFYSGPFPNGQTFRNCPASVYVESVISIHWHRIEYWHYADAPVDEASCRIGDPEVRTVPDDDIDFVAEETVSQIWDFEFVLFAKQQSCRKSVLPQ